MKIIADHPDDLRLVADLIHDCWFDLEAIVATDSQLVIPLERQRGRTHVKSRLTLEHVARHTITDSERVGRYDFNKFTYDEASRALRLLTGIPLEFIVTVDKLSVRLEDD